MLPYVLFFVMLISLILLISSYYNNHPSRIVFKCITSILFIEIGVSAYIINHNSYFNYFILIFIGLFTAFIGDFALAVYNAKNRRHSAPLIAGIVSFSVTHLMYIAAFSTLSPVKAVDVIIYVIAAAFAVSFMVRYKSLDFKKYSKFVITYVLLVTAMLIKALSTNCMINKNPIGVLLITCGALLFFISDFVLCFIYFKKDCPSYFTALNLSCYYIGQGLTALSILYIMS